MKILIISGNTVTSEDYKKFVHKQIELLWHDRSFTGGSDNKIGILLPGERTEIFIEESGIVKFFFNSYDNGNLQIPKLTLGSINDINNFITEFRPDLIHSFDEGFLGLMSQYRAVRKKVPYILTLLPQNQIPRNGLATKVLSSVIRQFGFTNEFVKNYYHNCRSLITTTVPQVEMLHNIHYQGEIRCKRELDHSGYFEYYSDLLNKQPEYIRSKNFQDIVKYIPEKEQIQGGIKLKPATVFFMGTAVLGSLLAYTALKGFSIFTGKKKRKINRKANVVR